MSKAKEGAIVVFSGPSGVGKNAVIEGFQKLEPTYNRFPSVTTREPRPGELDGVDYHFVNDETFSAMWLTGQLLDNVQITGNRYGLAIAGLLQMVRAGRNIVLHLVPGSALLIKGMLPETKLVFITAPTETVVGRLRKRGMSLDDIAKRQVDDHTSSSNHEVVSQLYDLVVENPEGEIEANAAKISAFVNS